MTYVLQNAHWFILFIGILVVFHELGHFLVARACGVRVLRFSFGMGPRLFSITRGGTEYQVSLLPLGGYVKMLGDGPGQEVAPEEAHLAFNSKALWQRTAIVIAGPMFNFILALGVYFAMFSGTHTFGDTRLGVVVRNDPAWMAGMRPGDKIIEVEGKPVRHWDEMRAVVSERPNEKLKIAYLRGGVRHDAVLTTQNRPEENAFRESENRGKIGVSLQFVKPILGVVDDQSPAAQAGLRTGDVVSQVNGHAVTAWHELRDAVGQTPSGSPVHITYTRDGIEKQASIKPAAFLPGVDTQLFSAADTEQGYTGLVDKDTLVDKVEPNTPAEKIGLVSGDRLLQLAVKNAAGEVATRPVGVWNIDLASFGFDARSELTLTWQHGREVITQSLHLLQKSETDEFKETRTTYVLGALNDQDVTDTYTVDINVGLAEASRQAAIQVGDDMTLIGQALSRLVRGTIPLNSMGGPIMLFVIAEKSAKRGAPFFMRTLAMISVNIGLMNLLPVPMLDGGHLVFFAIEGISRRPPSLRLREAANMVGLALLLLLMVLVFHNDLLRFVFHQ